MNTKICSTCKEVKPVDQFFRCTAKHDGLASQCKVCSQKRKRAWREANRERIRIQDALYREKNKETINARVSAWGKEHRELRAAVTRRQREKWPERTSARQCVRNAVRAGILPDARTMQCSICGKQAEQLHHHNGYSFEHRLDVVPLCRECHVKEHAAR